ncbi:MAG: cytochrome c [Sphingobacteriaceae bacterium]|nr:cytochrome c [Sphingobacteriaceae bacterium]
MRSKPIYIFLFLCISFLIYSFSIYLKPLSVKEDPRFDKKKASEGRLVWQAYNCQSCHQLYSLGGYLGPDLTNIISNPYKGEQFVRTMIKAGVKQMPSFNLADNEMNSLIEFLRSTDASGRADVRQFNVNSLGVIEQNEVK